MNSKPKVAVLGASADRSKYGNKSVRAHQQQGYEVYPINPKGGEIEGLTCYPSLQATGVTGFDRISVYLPPTIGVGAMDEIAEVGCKELWLNPGSDGPEVIAKAESLGLEPIIACSIVDLGESPGSFPG